MNKHSPASTRTVRDPETGKFVTVHGIGALKDRLPIRKDLDLTKPIAAQVAKGDDRPKL